MRDRMLQVRDVGNLLTACGFGIPTVDVDDVMMQYDDVLELVRHLRALGESNAVLRRQPTLRYASWAASCMLHVVDGHKTRARVTHTAIQEGHSDCIGRHLPHHVSPRNRKQQPNGPESDTRWHHPQGGVRLAAGHLHDGLGATRFTAKAQGARFGHRVV